MSAYSWWGLGAVAAIGLAWWWCRPVHWRDGEGTAVPEDDWMDTDVGSRRWALLRGLRGTWPGELFWRFLHLRDWWENERQRRR